MQTAPSKPPCTGAGTVDHPSRAGHVWENAVAVGRDGVVPVAASCAVAFALVPAGRAVAWFAMLGVASGLGWLLGRSAGTTAAAAAGLLYLWAHGRPRFAPTITDPWTIRLGILLGILGAIAAVLADGLRRAHRHPRVSTHR